MIDENFPANCFQCNCIAGIDEAGRGPVIGPMVYGLAFWPESMNEEMCNLGFNDSKQLSANDRENLFQLIKDNPNIGYVVQSLSAEFISENMLHDPPVNLNILSHNSAASLVHYAREKGVRIRELYVDTVGIESYYQEKLTNEFNHEIQVTVSKKADSLYKTVSAASICAKVTRDRLLSELHQNDNEIDDDFGSGYPSDPKCVSWMASHLIPVFGYTDVVRFSWAPIKKSLEAHSVKAAWEADEEEKDDSGTPPITSCFMQDVKNVALNKLKRCKLANSLKYCSSIL